MSESRDKLNEVLRDLGYDARGDLVVVQPKWSKTREVRGAREAIIAVSTDIGAVFAKDGVCIERFRENSVVLWAHDYEGLPVGRAYFPCVCMIGTGPELSAKLNFHQDTELAREAWGLVNDGVRVKWELGVIPTEWNIRDDGIPIIAKWDLVEISAVPSEECKDWIRLRIKNRTISSTAMLRSVEAADAPTEPASAEDGFDEAVGPYSWRRPWKNWYNIEGPGIEAHVGTSREAVRRVNELNAAWRHGHDCVAADAPEPPTDGLDARVSELERQATEHTTSVNKVVKMFRDFAKMQNALRDIAGCCDGPFSQDTAREALKLTEGGE